MKTNTIFLTIASADSVAAVRLLIDSLRTFGGDLADAPFWIFTTEPVPALEEDERTHLLPLQVPGPVAAYPFGRKVAACARAEEMAPAGTHSLVWIDPYCLIVQPPMCFALGPDCDAAFRPVHIRNVGLPPSAPLDAFWGGIYTALGVTDLAATATSFVEDQVLRAYFNSHAFAVNPSLGLMRGWYEHFQLLVSKKIYQEAACTDEVHQIFLFQALLSTLVAASIEPGRLCILPTAYNYPLHLHGRVPAEKRPVSLNDVVCFAYEDCSLRPEEVTGIEVREPLRTWLAART